MKHSIQTHAFLLLIAVVLSCSGGRQDSSTRADPADALIDHLPGALELEVSNLLYGGDIAAASPLGRSSRAAHAKIVAAVQLRCRELDAAYDALYAANKELLSTTVSLQAAMKQQGKNARWLADELATGRDLFGLAAQEALLNRGIAELRGFIEAEKQPLHASRSRADWQLQLLSLYAEALAVHDTRVRTALPRLIALHHLPQSPVPPDVRSSLQSEIEQEARAMDQVLSAHPRMLAAAASVATGISGVKELMRQTLLLAIEESKQAVEALPRQAKQVGAIEGRLEHAELIIQAIALTRLELSVMEQAAAQLQQSSAGWYGIEGLTRGPGSFPKRQLQWRIFEGTAHAGPLDVLGAVADKTLSAMSIAVKTGAQAVSTVASTVAAVPRHTVAATSLVTKVIADAIYARTPEQRHRQILDSLDEWGSEIRAGRAGAGAFSRAIEAHEAVDKAADDAAAGAVSAAIGDGWLNSGGWLSWGAGKVAAAVSGTVTSLGKGALQLTNPDATTGQIVEGVINVGTSIIGGSAVVGGASGGGLKAMMSSVKDNALDVASNGFDLLKKILNTSSAKAEMTRTSSRMTQALSREVFDVKHLDDFVRASDDVLREARSQLVTQDKMTQGLKAFLPNVFDDVARGLSSGFSKEKAAIVSDWTKTLAKTELLQGLLNKITPQQLLGAMIDSAIAENVGKMLDTQIVNGQWSYQTTRSGIPAKAAGAITFRALASGSFTCEVDGKGHMDGVTRLGVDQRIVGTSTISGSNCKGSFDIRSGSVSGTITVVEKYSFTATWTDDKDNTRSENKTGSYTYQMRLSGNLSTQGTGGTITGDKMTVSFSVTGNPAQLAP